MKLIGLAALTVLMIAGCGAPPQSEYERYTDTCHERGGFISQHSGWTTFDYSCVGQTTGAPLPPMAK